MQFLDGKPLEIEYAVTSTLANKNFFSEVLFLFLFFLLNGLFSDSGKWKIVFVAAIVIDLFFLVLLQSTAVWLALIISIFVVLVLSFKNDKLFIGNSMSNKSKWIVTGFFHITIFCIYNLICIELSIRQA